MARRLHAAKCHSEGTCLLRLRASQTNNSVLAECLCGAVAILLRGSPIGSLTCCCDTCQEGSRLIESLPGAPAIREPDGGTAYVLYRKDRVEYTKGNELLKDYILEQNPKTNRVVASCCSSPMLMRFDDARHWTPVYRARLGASALPVQMRICTSFLPDKDAASNDVPSYADYAPGFMMKLLASRVAMLFG